MPVRQSRWRAFRAAANLRRLALGILDVLRLVERNDVPFDGLELISIADNERVGGDDQIVPGNAAEISVPVIAVQNQHIQGRCELRRLARPVSQDGCRGQNEGWPVHAAGHFFGEQMGQGLHGFPQAHVIRQDAVQAEFAKELQPGKALALIRAQLGFEAFRRFRESHLRKAGKALLQCRQFSRRADGQAVEFAADLRGTQFVEVNFAILSGRPCGQEFIEKAQQHEETAGRHREHGIARAGQGQEKLLVEILLQHGGCEPLINAVNKQGYEGDALPFDIDPEIE